MFAEAFKTIGFGLFINSTYGIMNGSFAINLYIAVASFAVILASYALEKRSKK